jgi:hypothetical protein
MNENALRRIVVRMLPRVHYQLIRAENGPCYRAERITLSSGYIYLPER